MKKEELKAALSKIEPDEKLILATLSKMNEQQQKEKKSRFSFMNVAVYRYAATFCALALVIGIGAAVINNGGLKGTEQNPSNVQGRNAENVEATTDTGINIVAFTLDDYEHGTAAVLKGKLKACFLSVETGEEAADGSVASGALEIAVSNVENGAGYAALEGVNGSSISAKIYFASQEEINTLVNLISEEVYFSIVPEEKDGEAVWKVTDFSLERIK